MIEANFFPEVENNLSRWGQPSLRTKVGGKGRYRERLHVDGQGMTTCIDVRRYGEDRRIRVHIYSNKGGVIESLRAAACMAELDRKPDFATFQSGALSRRANRYYLTLSWPPGQDYRAEVQRVVEARRWLKRQLLTA